MDDGSWLLTRAAEHKVAAIARVSRSTRALGKFMLRQRIAEVRQRALRRTGSPALRARRRRPSQVSAISSSISSWRTDRLGPGERLIAFG